MYVCGYGAAHRLVAFFNPELQVCVGARYQDMVAIDTADRTVTGDVDNSLYFALSGVFALKDILDYAKL